MIGLVYKDFLLMRKQILYMLFLAAVYSFLTVTGTFGPYILSAFVTILGLIYPMNAFSYDDLARWDKFAAATPAGRRGMVAGRYLFTLLLVLGASGLVTLLLLVLKLLRLIDTPVAELLVTTLACATVTLVMDAVVLPLLYKFGVEKARVISMAVFVAVFGGCMAAGLAAARLSLPAVPDGATLLIFLALAALAAAVFLASYSLSQRIYARKEL